MSDSLDQYAEGDFVDPDLFFSKKTKVKEDPELDNFLSRVENISGIIQGLASDKQDVIEKAIRQADILLHDGSGDGTFNEDQVEYKVKSDRSVVNKAKDIPEGADMSQDAFMRMCEEDAKERAADKKERKQKSDEYRKKGNIGFKKGNYAEALQNYNKAIDLIKDSPCLYMNRALTYIRIGICTKAVEDLDLSIQLYPETIKGRLLKARAYFNMAKPEMARLIIQETFELFPNQEKMIKDYEKDLFDMKMISEKPLKPSSAKEESKTDTNAKMPNVVSDVEEIWRKAARHELGQDNID